MSTEKSGLDEVMDAFTQFKDKQEDRFLDLQEQVDRIEAAAGRAGQSGCDDQV